MIEAMIQSLRVRSDVACSQEIERTSYKAGVWQRSARAVLRLLLFGRRLASNSLYS